MLPYVTHKIIKIGSIYIKTFPLLMFVGLLIFVFLFAMSAHKKKKKPIHIFMLSLLIIVGVWVGSRLFHVLFNLESYSINFIEMFDLSGGFASFGGVAFTLLLYTLYIKFYHLKFFEWADIIAPYLPLVSLFTRIGCFLNGCCYGLATNLPWGVRHLGEIRHPTPIYHVIAMSIMFLILLRLKMKKMFAGFLVLAYLTMYFTQRFIIDFFRYYDPEYYLFFLTKFQWISLTSITLCALIFIKIRKPKL